jgi:hypothetical protein
VATIVGGPAATYGQRCVAPRSLQLRRYGEGGLAIAAATIHRPCCSSGSSLDLA